MKYLIIIMAILSFNSVADTQLARVKQIANTVSIELNRPVVWVDGSMLGLGRKTLMGQTTGVVGETHVYIIGVNQKAIQFMSDKTLKSIIIHELAHAKADDVYGINGVISHGKEWKKICRDLSAKNSANKKMCKAKY